MDTIEGVLLGVLIACAVILMLLMGVLIGFCAVILMLLMGVLIGLLFSILSGVG